MREFDWQDDRFFKGLLGSFQTSNIIPLNVGLLHDNSTCKVWKFKFFNCRSYYDFKKSVQHKMLYPGVDFWISFSLNPHHHCRSCERQNFTFSLLRVTGRSSEVERLTLSHQTGELWQVWRAARSLSSSGTAWAAPLGPGTRHTSLWCSAWPFPPEHHLHHKTAT